MCLNPEGTRSFTSFSTVCSLLHMPWLWGPWYVDSSYYFRFYCCFQAVFLPFHSVNTPTFALSLPCSFFCLQEVIPVFNTCFTLLFLPLLPDIVVLNSALFLKTMLIVNAWPHVVVLHREFYFVNAGEFRYFVKEKTLYRQLWFSWGRLLYPISVFCLTTMLDIVTKAYFHQRNFQSVCYFDEMELIKHSLKESDIYINNSLNFHATGNIF